MTEYLERSYNEVSRNQWVATKSKEAERIEARDNFPDEQQAIFIESYCTWFDFRRARTDAGWSHQKGMAQFKMKKMQDAIWDNVRAQKASPHEIVHSVMDIARGDIGRVLDATEVTDDEGNVIGHTYKFNLSRALDEGMTYSIKSLELDRWGNVKKIAMEDKLQALELVGRAFGVFPREPDVKDDRDFVQRARDLGYDPVYVFAEMSKIQKQLGAPQTLDNDTGEEVEGDESAEQ